jgi:hypothetical protein
MKKGKWGMKEEVREGEKLSERPAPLALLLPPQSIDPSIRAAALALTEKRARERAEGGKGGERANQERGRRNKETAKLKREGNERVARRAVVGVCVIDCTWSRMTCAGARSCAKLWMVQSRMECEQSPTLCF